MSAEEFGSDLAEHRGIIAAGQILRRRPIAFRDPFSGPSGRRAQRACDQEAQCFDSRTPHGIHPLAARGRAIFGGKAVEGMDLISSKASDTAATDLKRCRVVARCRRVATRSAPAEQSR
jgi:hypothetical protein